MAGRPAEYFEALSSTGLPRQPRQYFERLPEVHPLLPPVDPGTPETSFDVEGVLEAGTTPNGVFGAKVMWTHRTHYERRIAGIELPRLRHVQMVRRDKIGQAVSLWTAVQTLRWRDEGEDGEVPEPVYSFAAIRHLARELREQEDAWTAFLDDPHVVVYEELAADPQRVVGALLDDLGIEGEVPAPRMRRQADGRSREWVERYRSEA